MKQNLGMPIAIILAGVVIAGAIIYTNKETPTDAPKQEETTGGTESIARALGLDVSKFNSCTEDKTFAQEVSKQHSFSKSLGLNGTPHSVVILKNGTGYRINGAYPYDTVAVTLEAALSGVGAGKIQQFLDMFQEKGITEETLNAYVQKEFIPAITARQNGDPKPEGITSTNDLIIEQKDQMLSIGHTRGSNDAEITLVEFSDPECPYCIKFHATMEQIFAKYGTDGSLAWRYVNFFPFDERPDVHPNSRAKAEAAECAASLGGEEMFWNFLKAVFEQSK